MTGYATSTDQDLAAAALHGDRQAYGELVGRHWQGAVGVVYRMCGDQALAEEAAQEAFLKAWQRLHQYKAQYAFRNWLYRIAINLALDELRREPIQVGLDDPSMRSLAGKAALPETEAEQSERRDAVRKAVLSLPPASRAVLVLREYESLSYSEIAAALDIPVGTVMSRLNYARSQLRKMLAQELEMPC